MWYYGIKNYLPQEMELQFFIYHIYADYFLCFVANNFFHSRKSMLSTKQLLLNFFFFFVIFTQIHFCALHKFKKKNT